MCPPLPVGASPASLAWSTATHWGGSVPHLACLWSLPNASQDEVTPAAFASRSMVAIDGIVPLSILWAVPAESPAFSLQDAWITLLSRVLCEGEPPPNPRPIHRLLSFRALALPTTPARTVEFQILDKVTKKNQSWFPKMVGEHDENHGYRLSPVGAALESIHRPNSEASMPEILSLASAGWICQAPSATGPPTFRRRSMNCSPW